MFSRRFHPRYTYNARRRRGDGEGGERGGGGCGGREADGTSVVKHDDWRSAAPFFEVVAAKLQGPSPGPETLAWPPNYHYGGSPFRARCPLPGTKLLGRGPARRAPFYLLLPASLFFPRPPPCGYPPGPPTAGRSTHKISSSPFTSSPRSDRRLSIFSCAPRHGNGRVRNRHNQQLRRNSNDEI